MPEQKIMPAPTTAELTGENGDGDGNGNGQFRREQVSRLGSALVLGPYMVYSSRTVQEPWFRRGLAVIGLATIGYNAYLYLRDFERAGAFGLGNLGGAAQRNLERMKASLAQSRKRLADLKAGESLPEGKLVSAMRAQGMSDDAIRQRLITYAEQSIAGIERNLDTTRELAEREAEKEAAEEALPEPEAGRPIDELADQLEAAIENRWLPDTSALRSIVSQAETDGEAMRSQLEKWVRRAEVNKQSGERVAEPETTTAADESDETEADDGPDKESTSNEGPVKETNWPAVLSDFKARLDGEAESKSAETLAEWCNTELEAMHADGMPAAQLSEAQQTCQERVNAAAESTDDVAQWDQAITGFSAQVSERSGQTLYVNPENAPEPMGSDELAAWCEERIQAFADDGMPDVYLEQAREICAAGVEYRERAELRDELTAEHEAELDELADEFQAELMELAESGASQDEIDELRAEWEARIDEREAEMLAELDSMEQPRTLPAPVGGRGNGQGNGEGGVQTAGAGGLPEGWVLPAALAAGAAVLLSRRSQ